MNRYLDYRTDFYSLGVTFYELLTGQLPFATTDVLELVHCHMAKPPKSPHEVNREIPQAVSDLIMKLMAKTAEERYQSAWGILADLEECRRQLEATGTVEDFPIGFQDISDKFQIPQKLYGREAEVETLMAAFERVAAGTLEPNSPAKVELMLVTGYSGIGKSALVQELYKPITRLRGYFIYGKFDQFQRNIPYAAVVSAFTGLVRQLLAESESQLKRWREKLLAAFGRNGQVIIDVIPEVELIVGKQPAVPELGATESQNRFNLVFQNFIRVFCSSEHPLVIFLDDLQWVCPATLKLLELMMTDTDMQYLFVIGAYRDNQVNSTHPLMMILEELRQQGATINQITLAPLALNHLTQLIAETLHSNTESVKLLAELVGRKTGGNPFFVSEFLKTLYTENLLTFSPPGEIGRWRDGEIITPSPNRSLWQWDIAQIEAQDITDNVVELMIGKLKKLPTSTQHLLRLAACVGAEFDLNTLSIICEKSSTEIFSDLMLAVQLGLILPTSELDTQLLIQDYKFGHDRIQQAAYALIDEVQKKAVHLEIGRLLLHNTAPEALSEKLFEIVDHLNVGVGASTGALPLLTHQAERDEIAKLNLMAGQKALTATAYQAALKYLNVGLDLLAEDCWQTQYDLTLNLYELAAYTEYLNTNYQRTESLSNVVLQQAKTVREKAKAYETKIQLYIAQNQMEGSIDVGLQFLKMLGVSLSKSAPSKLIIEDLYNLPPMTDPDKLVAMRILKTIWSPIHTTNSPLAPLIIFTMVELCVNYGNSSFAAFAYILYGLLLCRTPNTLEFGYQLGKLSLKMLKQFDTSEIAGRVNLMFNCFIQPWKEHKRTTLQPLQYTLKVLIETGDIEYASYAAINYCSNLFLVGESLESVNQNSKDYINLVQSLQQDFSLYYVQIWGQLALNLLGNSRKPNRLVGELFNENEMLPILKIRNNIQSLFVIDIAKTKLSYLFKNYSAAVKSAENAIGNKQSMEGMLPYAEHNFYYSLSLLANYLDQEQEQKQYIEQVAANQKEMKGWADQAPMNFQHTYDLVEAEKARVLGQVVEAMKLYERAIKGARDNGYIQEEALAYELAANFYLAHNLEEIAQTYLTKAHYGYVCWGAKAKVKDLEQQYPQFFAKRSSSSIKTTQTILDTSRQTSTDLDLLSIVKASQTLSGELMLDILLEKMMKLLIENAGAQIGYLILNKSGQWVIEASATIESDDIQILQSIPIETVSNKGVMPRVPLGVVNYVTHTQESIVLNDAIHEGNFTSDPYIIKQQPKSVLCAPLLNQGKLVGILYLENNLTTGAFTLDRLEILNLLSSQAAISIENAKLYADVRATEVKLTQSLEALRKSEARFRLAVDNFPDGVFVIYDAQRRFQFVNAQGVRLGGVPESALLGHTDEEIHPPEITDAYLPYLQKAVETRTSQTRECTITLPSVGQVTFVVTYVPLLDEQGEIYQILGITHDITLRKQSEKQIQESLREKEVLLQEIHHRVKNNLQVISSLLDLQSQQLNEPHLVEMFRNSRNRVKSMALVHEKLYESKSFAKVSFSEYIETLVMNLLVVYEEKSNQIDLELNLDEVALTIDTAIPCGLIINELVSNALKYAFPNQTRGTIFIAFNAQEDKHYTLVVRDNGIGLPPNFNFHTVKSLGLQLVKILASQLEGTLQVDDSSGTEFQLKFSELNS
jgi:PAS domain S-box-containing protein